MAGTGKSALSWTFAKWLTDQARHGVVNFGASFFKRGEGDRGNASRFFSTITRGLVLKVPSLDRIVAEVIASDPTVFDKALGEQLKKMIYQPLHKVTLLFKIALIPCRPGSPRGRKIRTTTIICIHPWVFASLLLSSNSV